MSFLKNLSMRYKLLLLILPAMLMLLFLFISRTNSYLQQLQTMEQAVAQVELLKALNPLITELQKERGLSAVYLASQQSPQDRQSLQEQQQKTDTGISGLQDFIRASAGDSSLSGFTRELQGLTHLRQQVLAASADSKTLLASYTRIIVQGLGFNQTSLQQSQVPDILRLLSGYSAISNLTEMAGRERASGAAYIKRGIYHPSELQPVTLLQGMQQGWQDSASLFLQGETANLWQEALNDRSNADFLRLRDAMYAEDKFSSLSAAQWFQSATARIDLLNGNKDRLLSSIVQKAEELMATARSAMWRETLLVGVVVFAVCLVALAISAQLHKQIAGLLHSIRHVMQQKDLSATIAVDSNDEIGEVSAALRQLFCVFSASLGKLDNASMQLATAMEESATTAGKNAQQLEHQQQTVEQVATASEEMSATSEQISRSTLHVAEAAVNVRDKSVRGEETVKQSIAHVHQLAESVQGVDQVMQELQQRSNSMIQVTEVIRNVADQTNLLALNAAIEAARAGEHGRGFAVVADEVRTLARQTHASTQQIQDIIAGFTELAASATNTIERSQHIAEESLVHADALEKTFGNILTDVKQISDMAAEIATASEQQVVVSRDVARSLEGIRDDSAQTCQGALEIRTVTRGQATLANELKNLAGEFKTCAA